MDRLELTLLVVFRGIAASFQRIGATGTLV